MDEEKKVNLEEIQQFNYTTKKMNGHFNQDNTLFVVGSSPLISVLYPSPSSSNTPSRYVQVHGPLAESISALNQIASRYGWSHTISSLFFLL